MGDCKVKWSIKKSLSWEKHHLKAINLCIFTGKHNLLVTFLTYKYDKESSLVDYLH